MTPRIRGVALFDLVTERFSDAIGPLASLVVGALGNDLEGVETPAELAAVLAGLAERIGDPWEAADFQAEVMEAAFG